MRLFNNEWLVFRVYSIGLAIVITVYVYYLPNFQTTKYIVLFEKCTGNECIFYLTTY